MATITQTSGGPAGGVVAGQSGDRRSVSSSLLPIRDERFGFEQARHLLLRAGFGGTPEQVQTLVKWGPAKSVEHLIEYGDVPYEPVTAGTFDKDIMRPANAEERGEIARARRTGDEAGVARLRAERQEAERRDRQQLERMQRWWLKRMIETPRPLEEKMTLFWHGHFATSYRTIEDSYHMFQQNQLFRKHAVGNFGELLFAIIRDPAMIAYLDNNDSRKGRPNENLARELMELFSLGAGNYSEQDIKEGARALTGYTFYDDEFVFQRENHDQGNKSILGRSGGLDGDDFVKAILEHPQCSKYMAAKLYRFFVSDYPTGRAGVDEASRSVLRQMASALVNSKYSVKPVLRKLLLSEHFYDPALAGEQVKSPVELVVGAVRSLNTPVRDLGVLNDALNLMGQNLLFPPSVKGWDGGRAWINTSTLFIRQNILCFLLTGKTPRGYDPLASREQYDPMPLVSSFFKTDLEGSNDPLKQVDRLLRFMIGSAPEHYREALRAHVASAGGELTVQAATDALLLISAMPEYQLC